MPKANADETAQSFAVRLNQCSHDYALGTWANVIVIIWRHETSLGGVVTLRKECERFAKLHPEGILLLTIVHEGAPPPSATVRSALASFLKGGNYIRASAVVMEGHSFRAAIVRGVVTGLTLLARQPFPHQIASLPEAGRLFERVSEKAQQVFSREAFEDAIVDLRAQVEARLRR